MHHLSLDYGTYRRPAKDQSSLRISALPPEPSLFAHISMEADEESDQKSDILPHWMAAHAHLKNEFTKDEKYHNLMTWLYVLQIGRRGRVGDRDITVQKHGWLGKPSVYIIKTGRTPSTPTNMDTIIYKD